MAKTTPMFKINQMAKDFGMKTKDLCSSVEEAGVIGKTTSGSLEPDEFNKFFEAAVADGTVENIAKTYGVQEALVK